MPVLDATSPTQTRNGDTTGPAPEAPTGQLRSEADWDRTMGPLPDRRPRRTAPRLDDDPAYTTRMVPDLSITNLRDDIEVRRTVRRTIEAAIGDTIIGTQRVNGGPIPAIGTPEWFDADHLTRVASIMLLGERYLAEDPEREIRQHLRTLVWDMVGAASKRRSPVVPHTELARRRAEIGPLHRTIDLAAAARWVTTGDSKEQPA